MHVLVSCRDSLHLQFYYSSQIVFVIVVIFGDVTVTQVIICSMTLVNVMQLVIILFLHGECYAFNKDVRTEL